MRHLCCRCERLGARYPKTANCDSNQACLEGGSRPSKCRLRHEPRDHLVRSKMMRHIFPMLWLRFVQPQHLGREDVDEYFGPAPASTCPRRDGSVHKLLHGRPHELWHVENAWRCWRLNEEKALQMPRAFCRPHSQRAHDANWAGHTTLASPS